MQIFIVFTILIATRTAFTLAMDDVELLKFHKNLMSLTNQILGKYFTDHRCLTLVSDQELFADFRPQVNIPVMRISPNKGSCDDSMINYFVEALRLKCDGYIIQLTTPMCFLTMWLAALEITENRHVPKYLFLPASPENSTYVDELFANKMSDVTVYIVAAEVDLQQPDWPITLWTNDFSVRAGTPGREKKYLDKWTDSGGFYENTQLYYDKILNLNGRQLKLSTFRYPTYTVVEEDTLEGTEGRMILEFCRIYNCTYDAIEDGYNWGSLDYSNGTAYGILGLIHSRQADIGYVGLYLWTDASYVADYSSPWGVGHVAVLVPKPVPLPPWKTPFITFDVPIWCATLMSFIICTLAFFALSTVSIKVSSLLEYAGKYGKWKRLNATALAVLGVLVLQSPPRFLVPKISSIRLLFISTELLALILTSCYAAELASYLTVPQFSKPIETVQDLADSNLIWVSMDIAYVLSLKDSEDEATKVISDNFRVIDEYGISMEELEKGISYGMGVEILPGGSYTNNSITISVWNQWFYYSMLPSGALALLDFVTDKMLQNTHQMKEYLYGSYTSLLFNKASPYIEHFNILLNQLLEAGIVRFWENEVSRKYFSTRTQSIFQDARKVKTESAPTELKLEHVQGIFFVYFVGVISSLLTFFYELHSFKKNHDEVKVVSWIN